ncbi:NAD(P)-binding domain-containing protein, partial [Porphyromonas sp.]
MTAERIVLLGAGRLATHLSRALKAYAPKRRIVQIYSPGGHSARRLAESLGGDVQVASRVDELDRTADCYLLAVPDTAIAEVAESLSAHEVGRDALWVHVSGATPLEALARCHRDAAVLYPLQTFSEGRELDFRKVPLYLEGTTPAAKTAVESLGRELS